MVISELVKKVSQKLSDNALFEAESIVMSVLGINRTELVLKGREETDTEAENKIFEMLKRRLSGEPLQYILGECGFMSLDFYVGEGVLIPRSDTETLAEAVINSGMSGGVLDICSGSGCIGISLAYYIKDANVTLLDISGDAVELSKKNIARHGLEDRVKTVKMDILAQYPEYKYDIVVSNPPYIERDEIPYLMREVRDYEPHLALDGGKDGLDFYRRIAQISPDILKAGGLMALEIGYNQGESVKKLLECDFDDVTVIKDLCGNDRVVTGRLKIK